MCGEGWAGLIAAEVVVGCGGEERGGVVGVVEDGGGRWSGRGRGRGLAPTGDGRLEVDGGELGEMGEMREERELREEWAGRGAAAGLI